MDIPSKCIKLQNPCYDRKTKKSCYRRSAGCAVNCPEWAEYLKKRNKLYEKRVNERKVREAVYKGQDKSVARALRRLYYKNK